MGLRQFQVPIDNRGVRIHRTIVIVILYSNSNSYSYSYEAPCIGTVSSIRIAVILKARHPLAHKDTLFCFEIIRQNLLSYPFNFRMLDSKSTLRYTLS